VTTRGGVCWGAFSPPPPATAETAEQDALRSLCLHREVRLNRLSVGKRQMPEKPSVEADFDVRQIRI